METGLMIDDVKTEQMANWSESNKKDFVKTFNDRVKVSRYILQATASLALGKAVERKYVGEKQARKLKAEFGGIDRYGYNSYGLMGSEFAVVNHREDGNLIGSRPVDELNKISADRAQEILKQLPPLQKAVQIISTDLSKKITDRDNIVEKGKNLTEKLVELSEPIAMSEVDQKMTIAAFRQMVKDTEKKRSKLVEEINELTKDGVELDKEINKALYAGLPGLSDAVVNAISSMMEKSKALDQLGRRVGEKVMFGNSEAALELLRTFESDETKLSDDIKLELATAMDKLKLAVAGKKKKQLKK